MGSDALEIPGPSLRWEQQPEPHRNGSGSPRGQGAVGVLQEASAVFYEFLELVYCDPASTVCICLGDHRVVFLSCGAGVGHELAQLFDTDEVLVVPGKRPDELDELFVGLVVFCVASWPPGVPSRRRCEVHETQALFRGQEAF